MNNPDDLDAIVSELNAVAPRAFADLHTARLLSWLEEAVARSASDLLLVAGAPRSLRVAGVIEPLGEGPLAGEEIADAIVPALPPHARRTFQETGIADASFRAVDLGRFRINLHHERGRAAAAIRRNGRSKGRLRAPGIPTGWNACSRSQTAI
jgi:Tfp pilus assembly ATPase PilU